MYIDFSQNITSIDEFVFYSTENKKYGLEVSEGNPSAEFVDESMVIPSNDPLLKTPLVKSYQLDKKKDFRSLNSRDLSVPVEKNEIYGEEKSNRGLLLQKDFFILGTKVFSIDYEYQFDVINTISAQKQIKTWYNFDGTIHDVESYEDYVAASFVNFSQKEKRRATYRRRESIIMMLEAKLIAFVASQASTEEEMKIGVANGASLLAEISEEKAKFIDSGITSFIINKLTELKTNYPVLLSEILPNITVEAFVVDFLDY